jgi:hypothetical protein
MPLSVVCCATYICIMVGIKLCTILKTSCNVQASLNQKANTWGRCYDRNILRFLTIFGEKWRSSQKPNAMIIFFQK